MVILTLINAYLPGYKAGGPIQSIANLSEKLGDAFQIKIITSDRDYGDSKPYSSVATGRWQPVGQAEVLYLSPGEQSPWNLRSIINRTAYDVLYLNSLFHPFFAIVPILLWRAGLIRRTPVVLAPRGELSPGALGLKGVRKRLFLSAARVLRWYGQAMFQASTSLESAEIQRWFPAALGGMANTIVAPDLPFQGKFENAEKVRAARGRKKPGQLRLLYASRISPKKNLLEAIRCLQNVEGLVEFNLLGPVEDESYWAKCQSAAKSLPPSVSLRHWGPVLHDRVLFEMSQHDLFFLPTLGENFGHAIFESLSAGCPVLIGSETPWRGLEPKQAGWDLPVSNRDAFRNVLQRCIEMDEQEHLKWRTAAKALASSVMLDSASARSNRDLFLQAARQIPWKSAPFGKPVREATARFPIAESKRHFDEIATSWEKKYQRRASFERRQASFVGCLRQFAPASSRVLDFGCGSGDIAIACSEAGYEVTGVDLSPAMIARARRRSRSRGITFDHLDSDHPLRLPYPDACFDAVIASSVFEYVRGPFQTLGELRRVCKPNGLLLATVPNLAHPQRWLEIVLRQTAIRECIARIDRCLRYAEYLEISRNRFPLSDWAELFERSGWQMQAVRAKSRALAMLIARAAASGRVEAGAEDEHQSEHAFQSQP